MRLFWPFRSQLQLGVMFQGEAQQRLVAFQAEFRADVGAMGFDGAQADEQLGGDLFAGPVLSDEFQDAPLGCGQSAQTRVARHELRGPMLAARHIS